MQFGIAHYPELTPQADWPGDLDGIAELGLDCVRVFDFAWAALEPAEGEYRWEWAHHYLDELHRRGLKAILCTPTATPPAWLASQYPSVMIELRSGQRRPFGSRRDVDLCSTIYRDYATEIASRMGEQFGQHPAVLGWQIDNELVGPELAPPESHSPDATWRFRRWLRQRYPSFQALNEAWGLGFWSQNFSAWGQVITPRHDRVSRGWVIDHGRFFSDMILEFARIQYDALRPVIRDRQWITHNCTAMFDRGIDHGALAAQLYAGGWDAYFGAAAAGHGHEPDFTALACDWLRTATRKPIKIMETSLRAKDCNREHLGLLHRHGADLIVFWHYRAHRGNVEATSHTILDYAGKPFDDRAAKVRELVAWGRELEPAFDATKQSRVALVYCLDNARDDMHRDPYDRYEGPRYLDAVIRAYGPARAAHGPIDVVPPGKELTGYQLVILPSPRLFDPENADALMRFVQAGGTLIVTGKAATRSRTAIYHPELGGPLRTLTGVLGRIDPIVTKDQPGPESVRFNNGDVCPVETWHDQPEQWDAEVLATFVGETGKDRPAVFARSVGGGRVIFAAANGDALMGKLLSLTVLGS